MCGARKPASRIRKVTVICPTYRGDGHSSVVRLLGPVALLEQMASQDFDGDINVVIVDSSDKPHPFFEGGVDRGGVPHIYLHVPNRNTVAAALKRQFPKAMAFIPDEEELMDAPRWRRQFEEGKAWDSFHPWDAGYPCPVTMEQQMQRTRPTIGMKRNAAIAAATETFGAPDLVIHADDDDFRSSSYVRLLAEGIGGNHFTRMSHYLTYARERGRTAYGRNRVAFRRMANGYWLPAGEAPLHNLGVGEYSSTVAKKMSPLKCLALPPICWEGALHSYRYELWERARSLGGFPITSMCEDIFFYLRCQKVLGGQFRADFTVTEEPHLLRTACGGNASVIEWTDELRLKDFPDWGKRPVAAVC